MKNFKSYLTEGPAGVTSNEIKADQDRVKKAQDWNRKETQRQMNNVPAPGVYSPGDDEGPVSPVKSPNKKLKEEETLDERAIRVRNVRSGAVRNVSSAFRHIYRKQGWNAVRGTRR